MESTISESKAEVASDPRASYIAPPKVTFEYGKRRVTVTLPTSWAHRERMLAIIGGLGQAFVSLNVLDMRAAEKPLSPGEENRRQESINRIEEFRRDSQRLYEESLNPAYRFRGV